MILVPFFTLDARYGYVKQADKCTCWYVSEMGHIIITQYVPPTTSSLTHPSSSLPHPPLLLLPHSSFSSPPTPPPPPSLILLLPTHPSSSSLTHPSPPHPPLLLLPHSSFSSPPTPPPPHPSSSLTHPSPPHPPLLLPHSSFSSPPTPPPPSLILLLLPTPPLLLPTPPPPPSPLPLPLPHPFSPSPLLPQSFSPTPFSSHPSYLGVFLSLVIFYPMQIHWTRYVCEHKHCRTMYSCSPPPFVPSSSLPFQLKPTASYVYELSKFVLVYSVMIGMHYVFGFVLLLIVYCMVLYRIGKMRKVYSKWLS